MTIETKITLIQQQKNQNGLNIGDICQGYLITPSTTHNCSLYSKNPELNCKYFLNANKNPFCTIKKYK